MNDSTSSEKHTPYDTERNGKLGIAKDQIPTMESLEDFNSIDVSAEFLSSKQKATETAIT